MTIASLATTGRRLVLRALQDIRDAGASATPSRSSIRAKVRDVEVWLARARSPSSGRVPTPSRRPSAAASAAIARRGALRESAYQLGGRNPRPPT